MSDEFPVVDLEHFEREGYWVARHVLNPETDLEPVKREYRDLLDSLTARWLEEGKVSSNDAELPFVERLCRFTALGLDWVQFFDISLPSSITANTPIHLGPAVFHMLRNYKLLDVVEKLIGSEIYSNPVQHIRIKPPERNVPQNLLNGLTAAVGWHQDMGVTNADADETNMISVWIAVFDATVENGCLQVVPGSHKGDLALHCNYGEGKKSFFQVNIPDKLVLPNQIPIPMKSGDALFFHKKLMHSSLPNKSSGIRWSFDLRYNVIGQPTGRAWLPGFVARSKAYPETELKDPVLWAEMWRETRARIAVGEGIQPSSRWNSSHPLCA